MQKNGGGAPTKGKGFGNGGREWWQRKVEVKKVERARESVSRNYSDGADDAVGGVRVGLSDEFSGWAVGGGLVRGTPGSGTDWRRGVSYHRTIVPVVSAVLEHGNTGTPDGPGAAAHREFIGELTVRLVLPGFPAFRDPFEAKSMASQGNTFQSGGEFSVVSAQPVIIIGSCHHDAMIHDEGMPYPRGLPEGATLRPFSLGDPST
ncbi:hypothetical protein N7539_002040 [Penicillium diatomitis]|uniref:Uncharacterized protein n=1 Tax=Penicillium diatomitis TaxID=2819901 RepID=A0A9W9XJ37_9EURO|nr:uncharacterized protein N7539_002040 [Penicillium diatomitis]KAJ5493294.1 hypothetical protein N7539_002040 [Penicillium diatomitis]